MRSPMSSRRTGCFRAFQTKWLAFASPSARHETGMSQDETKVGATTAGGSAVDSSGGGGPIAVAFPVRRDVPLGLGLRLGGRLAGKAIERWFRRRERERPHGGADPLELPRMKVASRFRTPSSPGIRLRLRSVRGRRKIHHRPLQLPGGIEQKADNTRKATAEAAFSAEPVCLESSALARYPFGRFGSVRSMFTSL
jgi:hypothetical protein